jgi:hypothetical protein
MRTLFIILPYCIMSNNINHSKYIEQINQAYNAGVANDEKLKNQILEKSYINLPNDCKNYVRNLDTKYTSSVYNGTQFGSIFSNYKNDVESANSIPEKILSDERQYFTKKYGEDVYNYLLKKREKDFTLKNEILAQVNFDNINGTSTTSNTGTINGQTINIDSIINNTLKNNENVKSQTMTDMYNKFMKYLPQTDSDLINRKIQYRNTEHDKLKWINSVMNIIYYSLLITLFIILYSADNLHFRERFLLYLFLIMAPLLFPFFYSLLKKIMNSIFNNSNVPIHGPKNAFLDDSKDKPDIPKLDGHNI